MILGVPTDIEQFKLPPRRSLKVFILLQRIGAFASRESDLMAELRLGRPSESHSAAGPTG